MGSGGFLNRRSWVRVPPAPWLRSPGTWLAAGSQQAGFDGCQSRQDRSSGQLLPMPPSQAAWHVGVDLPGPGGNGRRHCRSEGPPRWRSDRDGSKFSQAPGPGPGGRHCVSRSAAGGEPLPPCPVALGRHRCPVALSNRRRPRLPSPGGAPGQTCSARSSRRPGRLAPGLDGRAATWTLRTVSVATGRLTLVAIATERTPGKSSI